MNWKEVVNENLVVIVLILSILGYDLYSDYQDTQLKLAKLECGRVGK